MGQPERGHRPAEPAPLVRRVDPDDINLPPRDSGRGGGLDLGPVEGNRWVVHRRVLVEEVEEPVGVEPFGRDAFLEVGPGQAALFAVVCEGGGIEGPELLDISSVSEGLHGETLWQNRINRVLGRQRSAHDVQLTRDDQPGGSGQGCCRGQHAVGPDAACTQRHHLVEQGATVPATTMPRVHDQLGHGIRPARLRHLRIPDHGVVLVQAHQVNHALAGRTDRQPERLGDGLDAVGVLRPSEHVAHLGCRGVVDRGQARRARGARHVRTRSPRRSRRPRGRSGTRRCGRSR